MWSSSKLSRIFGWAQNRTVMFLLFWVEPFPLSRQHLTTEALRGILWWNIISDHRGRGWRGQRRIRLSWQIVNGLYFIYTCESWNYMKGQAHWRNCILYIDITSGRETLPLGTHVFWKAHFCVHLWLGCFDNLGFVEWKDPHYLTEGMSVSFP